MDLITGRTRPDEGTLTYHQDDGHDLDLTKLREFQINRLGISRKFQTPSIYQHHSVYENIVLSLNKNRSVMSSLFYKEDQADRDAIEEVLENRPLAGPPTQPSRAPLPRSKAMVRNWHAPRSENHESYW